MRLCGGRQSFPKPDTTTRVARSRLPDDFHEPPKFSGGTGVLRQTGTSNPKGAHRGPDLSVKTALRWHARNFDQVLARAVTAVPLNAAALNDEWPPVSMVKRKQTLAPLRPVGMLQLSSAVQSRHCEL